MIILQYPVNLIENYLIIRKIWEKEKKQEEVMVEDLLEYYRAKSNIFFKKWEDSDKKDEQAMMKVLKAIEMYDSMDNDEFRWFI